MLRALLGRPLDVRALVAIVDGARAGIRVVARGNDVPTGAGLLRVPVVAPGSRTARRVATGPIRGRGSGRTAGRNRDHSEREHDGCDRGVCQGVLAETRSTRCPGASAMYSRPSGSASMPMIEPGATCGERSTQSSTVPSSANA